MNSISKSFSHIYVEERARDYPLTADVVKKFSGSKIILIRHYKDVFNRPHQDYQAQKHSQKVILAVKESPFIYKGSDLCYHENHVPFYYTTPVINCISHCDYCFLQGMYPSSNIVIFVNTDSFIYEANSLTRLQSVNFSISYETDLPAMEKIVPLCSMWIEWAASQNSVLMEIRTKSANNQYLENLKPNSQTILAWTLLPQPMIDRYEFRTTTLAQRLQTAQQAIRKGWKTRLCWDPILETDDWERIYKQSVEEVFYLIPPEGVYDIHLGVFRMNAEYLKNIQKQRSDTDVVYHQFERTGKTAHYPAEKAKWMTEKMIEWLTIYVSKDKIRCLQI